MVPPAPRECNQPARSALHRNQFAAHRPTHLPSQRTARMQPARAHRIANNPSTVQCAARTYNQPAAHRPPRSAHRPSRSAHASHYFALVSFRLVRGTNFSKIQYIYIFIFQIFMTHLVYWLRCENLICGPRFDSGTSRVIVVGPRRRPVCFMNFWADS